MESGSLEGKLRSLNIFILFPKKLIRFYIFNGNLVFENFIVRSIFMFLKIFCGRFLIRNKRGKVKQLFGIQKTNWCYKLSLFWDICDNPSALAPVAE